MRWLDDAFQTVGAVFLTLLAFLLAVLALLIAYDRAKRWRASRRPPRASTPAAGPAPAPGPASAQVPPQPETDREPDSLVVPAPGSQFGHGRRIYTIRRYEDGAVYYWDANGNALMVVEPVGLLDFDEWLKGLTS